MMAYSYDRRMASSNDLLSILIQRAVRGRPIDSHMQAYIDELKEEWEDHHGDPIPTFDSVPEERAWEARELGVLHSAHEMEQAFQRKYIEVYRHRVPWASAEAAREVSEAPDFGDAAPLRVIEAVATEQAREDAVDARMMRDMARERAQHAN